MGRILCVGSINADYIYRVPHLPAPGETLNAASMTRMLGGKGANQSIAASLSGADVAHLGAIGAGDDWLIAALQGRGVDTQSVAMIDMPTGHAIINVDDAGENAIVLFPSANHSVPSHMLSDKISGYGVGDICLLQNEITISAEAAAQAKSVGMTVVYSAAPFSPDAVKEILPHADLLVMNEIEARDLSKSLNMDPSDLPCDVLVTRGADGSAYYGNQKINAGAFKVMAIDTTGAGDCYIGAFSAKRANGASVEEALRWAAAASAIQVSRPGTADAMPTKAEIEAFLKDRDQ